MIGAALESAIRSLVATRHSDKDIAAALGAAATPGAIALVRMQMRREGAPGDRIGICRWCGAKRPGGFDRLGSKPWPEMSLCGACAETTTGGEG